MPTWQAMCFVDTLKVDMPTKIIINFSIGITPQNLNKKKLIYQYQKKKTIKNQKKKKN